VPEVVEHLLSKCEALSSNPSTAKKKREREARINKPKTIHRILREFHCQLLKEKHITVLASGHVLVPESWDLWAAYRISILFFEVLRFELRDYALSHSTSPFFVMSFFEIGSCKLFAQAGFEL
jgi:hypothetical protein